MENDTAPPDGMTVPGAMIVFAGIAVVSLRNQPETSTGAGVGLCSSMNADAPARSSPMTICGVVGSGSAAPGEP